MHFSKTPKAQKCELILARNARIELMMCSFVCCTSRETSATTLLRSYHSPRGANDLYRTVRIWEAARATSAASTFFDSVEIGNNGQRFLDGGTGANKPDSCGEKLQI